MVASKGIDKEANDIETFTRLFKNLTKKVSKLKQHKTNTSTSSHPSRHRQGSSSSSNKWFTQKTMQEQLDDRDNDEGITPDEASSFGHVVNAY